MLCDVKRPLQPHTRQILDTCCCTVTVLSAVSSTVTRSAACACHLSGDSKQLLTGSPSSHLVPQPKAEKICRLAHLLLHLVSINTKDRTSPFKPELHFRDPGGAKLTVPCSLCVSCPYDCAWLMQLRAMRLEYEPAEEHIGQHSTKPACQLLPVPYCTTAMEVVHSSTFGSGSTQP